MKSEIKYSSLGSGIFTIPEISRLLGFPQDKVRSYLKKYWDEKLGRKLFNTKYTWSEKDTVAVNFNVLIELYVFFKLQEIGVKIKDILIARENICKESKVVYPFATKEILTDGKKIYYKINKTLVNADGSKQTAIEKILEEYLKKIDFDENDRAVRFYPNGKKSAVVVDPHHQFGQPTLKGTNIIVDSIWSMYKSGESKKTIKVLYELSAKQVEDVISFAENAA